MKNRQETRLNRLVKQGCRIEKKTRDLTNIDLQRKDVGLKINKRLDKKICEARMWAQKIYKRLN